MEQLSDETKARITQFVFPEYEQNAIALNELWPFIEPLKITDSKDDQDATRRRLEIKLGEGPTISVVKAKTTKLSNLRFNLKGALTKEVPEFSLEILGLAHESLGPLGPALLLLRLLRAAFDLSTIQLNSIDGMVLVELFKFAKEEHVIRSDAFFSYIEDKVDSKELYRSLNKLERLNCIELSDTNIRLIEVLIIK